mgnify:CR=1 FL=1
MIVLIATGKARQKAIKATVEGEGYSALPGVDTSAA